MNLPNKLTILRVILIVPFCVVMLTNCCGDYSNWIALAIFVIASITDTLDGMIARKNNLVTNFGKFMDPVADKLLVCAALICLMDAGLLPAWVVIVIMAREFIISGFRLVASDNGVVIAANFWGKSKTAVQMVMTILMLANIEKIQIVTTIVMYIAVVLTVISLIDYLIKNGYVMKDTK